MTAKGKREPTREAVNRLVFHPSRLFSSVFVRDVAVLFAADP